jgi:hypothetical protein
METQKFTVLVTLVSSVVVVLISSATNLWSKWIDTKQKNQDRALEFSKVYAVRKIDAGEAIIGRNNLLITQIRVLEQILGAYVKNYGYYHMQGDTRIDNELEKVNQLLTTDKSSYRLYFDIDDINESISIANKKCNDLMNDILNILEDMKKLVTISDDKEKVFIKKEHQEAFAKKQIESENIFKQYELNASNLKLMLVNNCKSFRNQLSKYDMS